MRPTYTISVMAKVITALSNPGLSSKYLPPIINTNPEIAVNNANAIADIIDFLISLPNTLYANVIANINPANAIVNTINDGISIHSVTAIDPSININADTPINIIISDAPLNADLKFLLANEYVNNIAAINAPNITVNKNKLPRSMYFTKTPANININPDAATSNANSHPICIYLSISIHLLIPAYINSTPPINTNNSNSNNNSQPNLI